MGERERIAAAEEALAQRRRVVTKLEAQANCQAQQQRAFARVSPAFCALAVHMFTAADSCANSDVLLCIVFCMFALCAYLSSGIAVTIFLCLGCS